MLAAAAVTMAAGTAAARPKKKPEPAPAPAPVIAAPAPAPLVPTLSTLMAKSEEEVKTSLGVPDIARKEGASAMWTYAWRDCALMVFFKSPDGRTLRVSGATAGPRRRNQAAPSVDACLAQNQGRPTQRDDAGAIDALLASPQ